MTRLSRSRTRRAVALAGMLAAVGGLVGVRAALSPQPVQALGSPGLASPVHGGGSGNSGSGKAGGSQHLRSRKAGSPNTRAAARHRTVDGNPYDVGYGTVQVRVTLDGRRITGVTALQLPSGGRSSDISGYAAPRLQQEALAAQSAHIDAVSGASYTSAGYASSLQSALDRAGV